MRRPLECTQGEWVRRQLLAGRSLAHPDLVKACGGCAGWRLAAHVRSLRKKGWLIESLPMPNPGPDTGLNPPVVYRLPPGWRPGDSPQLRLPL